MQGKFITFEGGEGSGKTTIILKLIEVLTSKGYACVSTREPGGSEIAEQIRSIILDVKNTNMTKETETLLYAASRMQHLAERVLPSLEAGKIVICDRYLDSSLAYQGIARGVGLSEVLKANSFALKHMPDLTFFIDVEPRIALKRLNNRDKMDRLDLEAMDFHNKVYRGYLDVCALYPSRIVKIDGRRDLDTIITEVIDKVLDFL